ncbi:hypothetical protein OTSSIDO_0066 [Orientia tsutsugamushi str. Sido]|nr:hypothetical protein OTSSIDO_0066 [Orientia tsutsugamushi str. Sido]
MKYCKPIIKQLIVGKIGLRKQTTLSRKITGINNRVYSHLQ